MGFVSICWPNLLIFPMPGPIFALGPDVTGQRQARASWPRRMQIEMPDLFESGVFGQDKAAWHGKGRVVAGTFSFEEAITLGGLDWETELSPVTTIYRGQSIEIPGKLAVVRSDNHRPLGIVGPEFRPIHNREALGFLESLLADRVCRFETAISVDQGRQVAAIVSLPDSQVEILKGDKHFLYLTVITAHDGSMALKAFPTDVRVVCANTIRAALGKANAGLTVSIRHSGDIEAKMRAGRDVIARARSDYADFMNWQRKAADQGVGKGDYEALLESLFPSPAADKDGKVSQRANTIRANKVLALTAAVKEEVMLLPQFTSTAGLRPAQSVLSAYVWLNGVTRYVDHVVSAGKDDRSEYALIGGGVDVKARAVNAINAVFPNLAK